MWGQSGEECLNFDCLLPQNWGLRLTCTFPMLDSNLYIYNIIDRNMEPLCLRRQDYQSCTLGSNIDYWHYCRGGFILIISRWWAFIDDVLVLVIFLSKTNCSMRYMTLRHCTDVYSWNNIDCRGKKRCFPEPNKGNECDWTVVSLKTHI